VAENRVKKMEITRTEENRNRRIAIGITLFAFGTLILFLVFKNIITNNQSFPAALQSEMILGLSNNNNENSGGVKTAAIAAAHQKKESADKKIVTDPNSEITNVKSGVEKITEQYKNHNSVSDNLLEQNSQSITSATTNEKGTSLQEKNVSDNPFDYHLTERSVVIPPKFSSDTKEEGKVVVDIAVDKQGNVIEANPNGRGTTTSSALLKAKAKQMAIATRFSANALVEEQRGTITIVFSFD